jgi:hypothetical protein
MQTTTLQQTLLEQQVAQAEAMAQQDLLEQQMLARATLFQEAVVYLLLVEQIQTMLMHFTQLVAVAVAVAQVHG